MDGRSLVIWYDGDCRLCRRSREWCENRSPNGDLRFRDLRTARDEDLPLPRRRLESALTVRGPDGGLWSGFEAWRRILAELRGWRWLSWISGFPPFRWIGPTVYRVVARARQLESSSR